MGKKLTEGKDKSVKSGVNGYSKMVSNAWKALDKSKKENKSKELNNKKIWHLGILPENRGQKIKIYKKIYFESLLDAEWYVFKKRWKKHSGKELRI